MVKLAKIRPVVDSVRPPRRIGRSILALLAGFVAVIVLSLATDTLLRSMRMLPPLGEYLPAMAAALATAYRTLYGVVGGLITARLAPDRPMRHALMGGAMGFVLSAMGAVVTWNSEPPLGPHWYALALVALAFPAAWVGGKLEAVLSDR